MTDKKLRARRDSGILRVVAALLTVICSSTAAAAGESVVRTAPLEVRIELPKATYVQILTIADSDSN
jgi:hypothetical protein